MEMQRAGNPLMIYWNFNFRKENEEVEVFPLEGKPLRLTLITPRGKKEIKDYAVKGSVIEWKFTSDYQKAYGDYSLMLEVLSPSGKVLMTADQCGFARIADKTCFSTSAVSSDTITLTSELTVVRIMPVYPEIGPNGNWWVDGVDTGHSSVGTSAYEYALSLGYAGTEEDYAAEMAALPVLNEQSRSATEDARQATEESIAQQVSADNYIKGVKSYVDNVLTPAVSRTTQAAENAEEAAQHATLSAQDAESSASAADAAATRASEAANRANAAAEQAGRDVETAIEAFGSAIANKADKIKFEGKSYVETDGISTDDFYYSMPDSADGTEDDIIATKSNLKKINGQDLFGKGNIVIEGKNYDNEIATLQQKDAEQAAKLTELSAEINNYETKVTDITSSFVEEKTLFYKWSTTTNVWTENKDYYWRLYKVEAGDTLLLRKKAERGTFMAVECDLADFVVGGKLGNLVIAQNAPVGDYTYDNTSADTKYVAILYKYYSYIYFEVFMTEAISIADKVRELEDAAKPITTERIADGAVTIEKTDFVEVKPDAQLFDKATMAIDDAWYGFDNNFINDIGGYAKFEVNQYTGEYTAIKIPMAKIPNVVVSQPKGVVYSYFAVDADMRVLSYGIPNSSINTGMSIAIPDGCVYLLISAKSYVADSFMVNEGTEVLPYQEYELATFVNGIKLTAQNEKKDVAKLYLPKVLHAVVGDTLQVFYRGLMSVVNPYGYDILLTCKKGKQFPRYFEYTPTTADIGETTFAVTLKDEDGNMLESKECKLVTKAAPSNVGAINIACFGDSLTTDGTWCAEAHRRITATNGNPIGLGLNNIKFVGKKAKGGAGFFGEGGWRWSHYVTEGPKAYRFEVSNVNTLSVGSKYTNNGSTFTIQEINVTNGSGNILCSHSGSNAPLASGTLTLSQGGGDSSISYSSYENAPTNPLWDATNNKMSFIPYANEYADGQLDVVYVLLGWNDVHRESYPYPTMMANCKTFIDTLHAEFPNAKMKLMGLQVCSINGGMGANYGAGDDYSDTYGTIRKLMKLNLAYKELAESAEYSSFVEYVDVASQFDSEYNMPYAETKVNTRSSLTERRGTNGVHPSNDGYMQIADVVYRNIIANL